MNAVWQHQIPDIIAIREGRALPAVSKSVTSSNVSSSASSRQPAPTEAPRKPNAVDDSNRSFDVSGTNLYSDPMYGDLDIDDEQLKSFEEAMDQLTETQSSKQDLSHTIESTVISSSLTVRSKIASPVSSFVGQDIPQMVYILYIATTP